METERMQFENFISRSHGYVGRYVGGADADTFTHFSGSLGDIQNTKKPSEELLKNYYTKLGAIRAYLVCAITIYIDKHYHSIGETDRLALTNLENEFRDSDGRDLIDIIQRATEIYDRVNV